MKTTIIATAIVLLTVTMLTNCQMTNKKLEALKKVQDAKDAQIKAIQAINLAYNDSIRLIKKELAEKTSSYQKHIAESQSKFYNDMQASKMNTEKKVAEMEQKNNDMINRLSNYQDSTQINENFEMFRYELGREMNELGKSIKSINS
jgi:uncharacterized membrane-anchored protein YhcB (DUF1043 family)